MLRNLRISAAAVSALLASCLLSSGTSRAQQRPARIDVEHYLIDAEINPRTQDLKATVQVRFLPEDDRITSADFELHNALRILEVLNADGERIPASRFDEFSVRLSFSEPLLEGEAATVSFSYEGSLTGREDSPVWGIRFAAIHSEYAYLLYPARWFPVSGYTTDSYTAEMNITVPSGYEVIASGLKTSDTPDADSVTFQYRFTQPSFPGSIAVVQGQPVRVDSQGVSTTLYFRGDSLAMASAYGEETGKVMTYLTSVYGLPPQSGLTVVETEEGTPNGYSAPGVLFLSTGAIGERVDSRLLANQIARQWWGALVSPATRSHMWIVNGAARYSELLWLEHTAGPSVVEDELRDNFVEALTVENPPLIQASRLEDYSPEYWAATAGKGAAVLHMLRYVIGDEPFGKLMKEFPDKHAWKSVHTDSFREASEAASGRDLRGFFIQWIESSGAPEFDLEYTVFRIQNGFRIMGKIIQDLDTFRMPIQLKIETEGNPEEKDVEAVGASTEFVVETFGRPINVIIDPNNRVLRFSEGMRVAVAIRRGEQFAEIGEFLEALKEYQKALDVNRYSSLAHYRVAEVFFLQRNYQSAANEFREALNGDLEPAWTEVWSHINLGKIFDITGQRERAVNEYNLALRTKDNTQGAQEAAAMYLQQPYERPRQDI